MRKINLQGRATIALYRGAHIGVPGGAGAAHAAGKFYPGFLPYLERAFVPSSGNAAVGQGADGRGHSLTSYGQVRKLRTAVKKAYAFPMTNEQATH